MIGVLYLLQLGVLPVFHYHMHAGESSGNDWGYHTLPSHVSSLEKKDLAEQDEIFNNYRNAEDSHSSHDIDFCSLCSGIYKETEASFKMTNLEIEFPAEVDSIEYDKLHTNYYSSSNTPRAPPADFS